MFKYKRFKLHDSKNTIIAGDPYHIIIYDDGGKWWLQIEYHPHTSLLTFSTISRSINVQYSDKEICQKDYDLFL